MPPKKKAVQPAPPKKEEADGSEIKSEDTKGSQQSSNKRKTPAAESVEPSKAPRRSGRGSKTQASQQQLLNYLLSKSAEQLCRPDDEDTFIQSHKDARTYSSSVLTPFEELLSAIILARPISHRLSVRTIRTVLNAPYNFTSPRAIREAGEEKVHEAVWEAKTQHKQKNAEEIQRVADVVSEKFTQDDDKEGLELKRVLKDTNGDAEKAVELLKESIKGFAQTGANIFMRRVQWKWTEAYPFVDDRTARSLNKLGLPDAADDLRKLLEKEWGHLDTENIAGDDEAEKKRRAYVVALERAIGADLEGKIDQVLEAAGTA